MNKRFSTLMAAALVAGGMSASAASVDGAVVKKLGAGNYMLTTAKYSTETPAAAIGNVISIKGGKANVGSIDVTAIDGQLWTLKVSNVAGSNRFVLVNNADGTTLSFNPANAVVAKKKDGVAATPTAAAYELSDVNTEWTWVSAPNAETELKALTELKSAFDKDSTMAVAQDDNGNLYAYKYANNETAALTTSHSQLTLQAVEPGMMDMTADDLNVLGTGDNMYFTLGTSKTGIIDAGQLIGRKFHAVDVEPVPATPAYVQLQNLDDKGVIGKYAYVDTAFHVASGLNENKLYKFANTKDADKTEKLATEAMQFRVQRNLFKGGVTLSVKEAALKAYNKDASTAEGLKGSHWQDAQSDATIKTYTTVSAIKLTADTEVLTLFAEDNADATKVNLLFSISSKEADNTLTSVADGVYTIKNDKGQYLAVPVYNTRNELEGTPEWVTVNDDEQSVAHMPAYQWVILKDRSSATAAPTSTVKMTNREFAQWERWDNATQKNIREVKEYSTIQLRQDAGAEYKHVSNDISYNPYGTAFLKASDSLEIKAVDAAILSDTLLGYKNIDAKDLLVNRYTFNYMHAYDMGKFIAKSAKDSLLTVLEGQSNFVIAADGDIQNYGYDVTKAGTRIAGLKQLRRQAYTLTIPAVKALNFTRNTEGKYVATSTIKGVKFFFKENNDLSASGKCYHALIELYPSYKIDATTGDEEVDKDGNFIFDYWRYTVKAGVSDTDLAATLKAIVMDEKRTSAFNIAKNDAPLYRRFNSLELEGNEGDAPDTLRLKEKYRGEYLQVENNKNFMVDGVKFLGIYTPDFTKDGKSFIVDTAFVNRFDGAIKPQYLISINRNDNPGTPGVDCTETGKHYNFDANGNAVETDKAHCVHATPATPGFHFGDYLVNFADSVDHAASKVITKDDYNWKGYTRAGFVKAVHMGDSLYILTGQFAGVTKETFKAADIIKAVADKKYASEYIVNLVDDKKDGKSLNNADRHKLVTWSMRFVDPEKASNEVEADRAFLMESQKASSNDLDIAPVNGQWLKMQNGCIVLSGTAGAPSSFDQITGADDALIFNVEKGTKEDMATENETITASTFSVIAKQGAVEVIGAAGKNVVITNILGQVIANTVLTSDDATIAASAGVVVVAVEGEDAVKAIVK